MKEQESKDLDNEMHELAEELNQAPKPKNPALIAAIFAAALARVENEPLEE